MWICCPRTRSIWPVDARWDALRQPIEASIGSTDRFTHMESALRKGIAASGDQTTGACHVILITDGIVDVKGGKTLRTPREIES